MDNVYSRNVYPSTRLTNWMLRFALTIVVLLVLSIARAASSESAAETNSIDANLSATLPDLNGSPDENASLLRGDGDAASTAVKASGMGAGGAATVDLARWRKLIGPAGPTAEQMQNLCAAIAEHHTSGEQLERLIAALQLSGPPVLELKNCVQAKTGTTPGSALQSAVAPLLSAPAIATRAEGTSSIEAQFRSLAFPAQQVINPSPADLEQFGYSLFASPVSTFAPDGKGPVDPDYVLGAGDTLNLLLWGRVEDSQHLQVERNGTVLTRQVGPIVVAGLTFAQAKKLIEGRLSQITGVKADVTMGDIRSIQVFVIGKVNRPGLYTVSALSHVSNALVAAGGISKIGSLRNIELRRDNQLIERIDLYAMLLRGNTASDVRIQQGDVIYVPVIGPVVAVTGNVKEPAIYETIGKEDLDAVLKMAGGGGAFSYFQRVQIERIENHQRRIALDVDMERVRGARFEVRDGDLLKVFTVLPQQRNVVALKGNVHRPGIYQWTAGMKIDDLLAEGEGVADRTYFGYALVRRIYGAERRVRFLPVELAAALAHPADSAANLRLEARDELTIYRDDQIADLPKVAITGEVRNPGEYPLNTGMRVSDLVYEAGGLKYDAYRQSAELVRTQVIGGASARYLYEDVDLNRALDGDDGANPELERGDRIFVQQASNWHEPWMVTVAGEVARPGPYVIREGERLDSLLQRTGGIRRYGYLPATVFTRESVKEMEQRRLDESRQRLRMAVAQLSLMPTQSESTTGKDSLTAVQHILASNDSQQAVGRVVLHLKRLDTLATSRDNIVLENGDRIEVPKMPAAVAVLGQVYNPGAIVYEPGHTVGDYLQKAGGPTEWADTAHAFLIRANGEVVTDKSLHYGSGALFPLLPVISGGLDGLQLRPGDTIYIPEKTLYTDDLKVASQVTQIIVNSVMAMAVFGILGTHL